MKSFTFSLVLYLIFLASGLVSAAPIAKREPEKRMKKRSLQDSLFPSSLEYTSGFTTADGIDLDGVDKVDLSDDDLNVFQVQSGMTHDVVDINGKTAWEAVYAKGSWNPSNTPLGGFGLYVSGADNFKDAIADAQELVVGYSIMFEDGFEYNKGGKLPGGCEYFFLFSLLSPLQFSQSYYFSGISNFSRLLSLLSYSWRCWICRVRLLWRTSG